MDSEHRKKTRRTIFISILALVNSILVGFIAKALILLINLCTSIFFFGQFTTHEITPAENRLGPWVIGIPVLGGLIVGIMARFGSTAIRGHGIPEAMEKIFKGESKIHPLITILKPLSAAISIGTGGPFGAEGPIISTGGALGSFCGQTLHITTQERKVLLAAGATAGMAAIFGTPFAAILLAIELLLFEFAYRSFVPVMIACVGGACMHVILFGTTATFPIPEVSQATTTAIAGYAIIGLIVGFVSVFVTKSIYVIEDLFEKLPIHWMWWPAIGGIAVGVIGYFAPETLGVGYSNITSALSGGLPGYILMNLCLWKFASWAIALGSGTSGGTLAPLLTIGSAIGCLLGIVAQEYFPEAGIDLPIASLVGMAALFAGSARALLTSIVFAMETTMEESTLLPLMAGCVTAYIVSFVMMKTTIMTEKIYRRGIRLPDSYQPDLLDIQTIRDVLAWNKKEAVATVKASTSIRDLLESLHTDEKKYSHNTIPVVNNEGTHVIGAINIRKLVGEAGPAGKMASDVISDKVYTVYDDNPLQLAVEFLIKTKQDYIPVLDRQSKTLTGIISGRDILKLYEQRFRDENERTKHISLSQSSRKMALKGRRMIRRSGR